MGIKLKLLIMINILNITRKQKNQQEKGNKIFRIKYKYKDGMEA